MHYKNERVPANYCFLLKVSAWTCTDKMACTYPSPPPRFPHEWLKEFGSSWFPHPFPSLVIGWTICGRVHQKSSTRKVTHLSITLTLGNLTLKFPWDLDLGLGFSHPTKLAKRECMVNWKTTIHSSHVRGTTNQSSNSIGVIKICHTFHPFMHNICIWFPYSVHELGAYVW